MSQETNELPIRVGFFGSAASADAAIRNLMSAGFERKEIAVICPESFAGQFAPDVPRAEKPGAHSREAIVGGAAVGAALGGLGLIAAAATGGVGLLVAAPVLVGGGAIAGGFGSLIVADGYDKGVGDYFDYAVQNQKIVVGVEIDGEHQSRRLAQAGRILREAGAEGIEPLN